MRFYLDTEFHEYSKRAMLGKKIDTIELISIGIVSEDGKEYYAIANDFNFSAAWKNEWLRENVLHSIFRDLSSKYLKENGANYDSKFASTTYAQIFSKQNVKWLFSYYGKSKSQIAEEIKNFVYHTNHQLYPNSVSNFDQIIKSHPFEFYAYYADYHWVAFCWLFGRMIDLPRGFPMYCIDLKQIMDEKANNITIEKGYEKYDKVSILKMHKNYPSNTNEHNALADAIWNKELHEFLNKI